MPLLLDRETPREFRRESDRVQNIRRVVQELSLLGSVGLRSARLVEKLTAGLPSLYALA